MMVAYTQNGLALFWLSEWRGDGLVSRNFHMIVITPHFILFVIVRVPFNQFNAENNALPYGPLMSMHEYLEGADSDISENESRSYGRMPFNQFNAENKALPYGPLPSMHDWLEGAGSVSGKNESDVCESEASYENKFESDGQLCSQTNETQTIETEDNIIQTEIEDNNVVQYDDEISEQEIFPINVLHADGQKDDEEYDDEVLGEKSIPPETGNVFSFGNKQMDGVKPMFKSMKEEILKNAYAPISKKTLKVVVKKCRKIYNGDLASSRKRKWCRVLRKNGIKMKDLIALKLYTDFDSLQRELKKSFRFPYNEEKDRVASFYWWYKALRDAFTKLSKIPKHLPQPKIVFCGISKVMSIDQFEGTYHGPVSTTTDLSIARYFAGNNGMIVVLEPETDLEKTPHKVLDISWISDYPDEKEYLLLDHKVQVKALILSSDYDRSTEYFKRKAYHENDNNASYPQTKVAVNADQTIEKMWFRNIDLKHFKYSLSNNKQVIQGIVNDDDDVCSSYNVDIGSQSNGFVEGVHHLSVMNKNGPLAAEYINQIGVISENQKAKSHELAAFGRTMRLTKNISENQRSKRRELTAFPAYDEKWECGQLLSIKLDLDEHRVAFFIDGDLRKEEDLKKGPKYYFIAQLCSSDDMKMYIWSLETHRKIAQFIKYGMSS